MENTPIENTPIGGVTLRSLVLLITIEASILGAYFKLNQGINDIKKDQVSDARYNELRLTTLETSVKLTQTQLENYKAEQKNNQAPK